MFLFAFAFGLLSIHLLSRYFSRSPRALPVPRVQQCGCSSNDFTRLASFIVSLIFFTTFLSTFQSCLLCFFFYRLSSYFFFFKPPNNRENNCVVCKMLLLLLRLPTSTVAATRRFRWLLWRRSKNVPSCRLDSGHFDRPTEMIRTV